ncbi:MAG: GAF domain-containing protein [Deltaproteobacteria bacterium]|nr:GAF domain-containing protein [Kofleriaceae bacterium]
MTTLVPVPAPAVQQLVATVQELSLARDLDRVMAIVRTAARRLTGADGATFVLRDQDRCYYADEDAISPLWKGQRFPMEACVSGWAMIHREPVAIPDIYADPRIPADAYRPTFVKSLVMVPIRAADPVGAIGTYWATPHVPSQQEIELLATLANSTSIAMENVQLYAELEARVAQRTADLVRVQRQKEELAQLLVHDLRSPASGIMLASKLRLRDRSTSEADLQRWRNVHTSAEAIHRMAMNLLDVMRSEDGTFTPRLTNVTIAKLLADVIDQMTPIAAGTGHPLVHEAHDVPAAIACDEEMIRRLLQNLIDNAIRHTPAGGRVTLRASTTADMLELRVLDEGPGIPPEHREAVFAKGVRLLDEKPASGRGLGLAFCKLAATAHGGTIAIETNEPHGCVFVVRLPLAR